MARDGTANRERILDTAQRLVLERGFAATSVDAVITEASASKGGFFHHFHSKHELGLALLERYAAADKRLLEEFMAAAEAETDDPAEQLVAFVRRFEQVAAELAPTQPGCLFVSFIYESQLAGDGFGDLIAELHPRVARAAAREARSRGPGASARHPRRPALPRRPRLHRLRGRLHPHPRDGRTDPPARPARPRAPLPRTALRALPRPARTRPAARGHRLERLTSPSHPRHVPGEPDRNTKAERAGKHHPALSCNARSGGRLKPRP